MSEHYIILKNEKTVAKADSKEQLVKETVSYMLQKKLFWDDCRFLAYKEFRKSTEMMSDYKQKAEEFRKGESTLFDTAMKLADNYKEEAIQLAEKIIQKSFDKTGSFRITFWTTATIITGASFKNREEKNDLYCTRI